MAFNYHIFNTATGGGEDYAGLVEPLAMDIGCDTVFRVLLTLNCRDESTEILFKGNPFILNILINLGFLNANVALV